MSKLSYIQNEILVQFIQKEKNLRYSDVRPEGLDNDLFNYHLQELVKKDYIQKSEDGLYSLTRSGNQYVGQLDALGRQRPTFKASIIAWVLRRNEDGVLEILNQERKRQPFYGDHSSIAGKILPGEKIIDAAKRKLKEESGLDGDFRFLGVVRTIRNDEEGKNIEDTIYHICACENASGELVEENEFGRNYWVDVKTAAELELKNKGHEKESNVLLENVEETLSRKDLFYYEAVTVLDRSKY